MDKRIGKGFEQLERIERNCKGMEKDRKGLGKDWKRIGKGFGKFVGKWTELGKDWTHVYKYIWKELEEIGNIVETCLEKDWEMHGQ